MSTCFVLDLFVLGFVEPNDRCLDLVQNDSTFSAVESRRGNTDILWSLKIFVFLELEFRDAHNRHDIEITQILCSCLSNLLANNCSAP